MIENKTTKRNKYDHTRKEVLTIDEKPFLGVFIKLYKRDNS
jgi:hypothetical protein